MRFLKVYDLAEDVRHIAAVQSATLETTDFGLVPRHGLFGSADWWTAVDDGRIRVHSVEGIISRVYMASMNDWPEFELNDRGHLSTWPRLGDPRSYVVGQKAKIEFVQQEFKKPLPGKRDPKHKIVLRQWLEFD